MMTLGMSYRQWLLGTTFFCTPELIARVAVPKALLKEIDRDNERRKRVRDELLRRQLEEQTTQAV